MSETSSATTLGTSRREMLAGAVGVVTASALAIRIHRRRQA